MPFPTAAGQAAYDPAREGRTAAEAPAFRNEGVPRTLTPEETAACQELYDSLLPGAVEAYRKHFNSQTKPEWMDAMAALVGEGVSAPPADPLVASVANGSAIAVVSAADAPLGTGTATVANSIVTNVKMPT